MRDGHIANHDTGTPHHCQCTESCPRVALKGQAFCAVHMRQCPTKSPLTGAEPRYEPAFWNRWRAFRESHNCFSYAMNVLDLKQIRKCEETENCNVPFPQPGYSAGHDRFSDKVPKTCPNMIARIRGDNPGIQITDFATACPAGASKIALIIDQSDDYHFLRQDSTGYWSHKPGAQKVVATDAFGHRIWNPRLANYNYTAATNSNLNYDVFCSFLCVPRNRPLFMKTGGGSRSATRRVPSSARQAKTLRRRS
jgi:hypothetical protein